MMKPSSKRSLVVLLGLALLLVEMTSKSQALTKEELQLFHIHKTESDQSRAQRLGIQLPEDFPLKSKGAIRCETCHGIPKMEGLEYEMIDQERPDFFRGGPYERATDFCYRCHQKRGRISESLHQMIAPDGSLIKKNCLYCHEELPDSMANSNPKAALETLRFRLDPEMLCDGCHGAIPHFNAPEHQVRPQEAMAKRTQLPLWQGKIICLTCHSAHQKGTTQRFKDPSFRDEAVGQDWGILYGDSAWDSYFFEDKQQRLQKINQQNRRPMSFPYRSLRREALIRLSAKNGTLCLDCHEFLR